MNSINNDGYIGPANETTGSSSFLEQTFLIEQILSGKWTITLCQVQSVSGGGIAAPAIVSVQPMVNQIDGQGNPTPHGVINNVPCFRLQGGSSAFIADPVVGDIGILACASRDISAVKNNLALSNPGSFRQFDPSDGLYIGGFLNAAPSQFIQFTEDGINIVSTSNITLSVGDTSIVITDGTITIGGIVWGTHAHTGVTTGAGDSGPPVV